MAYREPKVPPIRDADAHGSLRELRLFLREFCAAAWNADRRKDEEIERIKKRLEALEGR